MYLSMKSSPARWAQRASFEQANHDILLASILLSGFDYIDVSASLMLTENRPDPDCFRADGIHLSAVGYQRWRKIIDSYLPRPGGPAPIAGKVTQISAQ